MRPWDISLPRQVGAVDVSRREAGAALPATFAVRPPFGGPRPILVLSVRGELDQCDADEFSRQLTAVSGTSGSNGENGSTDTAVVIDFRQVTFASVAILVLVARFPEQLRLVLRCGGPVHRAVVAASLIGAVDVYFALGDAVFADIDPDAFD